MSLIVGALSVANGVLDIFRAMDSNSFSSVAAVSMLLVTMVRAYHSCSNSS